MPSRARPGKMTCSWERPSRDAPRQPKSIHSVLFGWSAYCRIGGGVNAGGGLHSPRIHRNDGTLSVGLDPGAMPSSGMFPAAGWPCPDTAMGDLSSYRSINANELAVWTFGDDVAHCAGAVKPCVGVASRPAPLGKVWRVSGVILAYDFIPYDLVDIDVLSNRVDARQGFCATATPNWTNRCLCGTRYAALDVTDVTRECVVAGLSLTSSWLLAAPWIWIIVAPMRSAGPGRVGLASHC